jgi:hypothetical protein
MLYLEKRGQMDVVITEWALNSYLELKHENAFTDHEYKTQLRPDAELLKQGWPPKDPKFSNQKFWGPATGLGGITIQHGFKMKWHNIGNGKIQLRLAIVILNGGAYLCQGYVKTNDQKDKREMARLKNRINDIANGTFSFRGVL